MSPTDQELHSSSSDDRHPAPTKPEKGIEILFDGEPLRLPSSDITPDEILAVAGLDAATNYLVLIQGRHQVSLQGKGTESMHIRKGESFIALSTGPTPTS